MDILIEWQTYQTEFNGATVTMEIRPLRRGAMHILLPHLQAMQGDAGDALQVAIRSLELQALAGVIFPDHVRNITGVTVNGRPPSPDRFADEVVLSQLTVDIIGQLGAISRLSLGDVKNCDGLSATPTSDDVKPDVSPDSPPGGGSMFSTTATNGAVTAVG